jgi:glycosyltransferase involved in cell wall biosynthesis
MEHRIALSVVVPTYRSAGHFDLFFRQLVAGLRELKRACEIVVVDDGSDDGTRDLLLGLVRRAKASQSKGHEQASGKFPVGLRLILLERNAGQQQASLCGIIHARGDAIATMDDDLQHPPGQIARLLEKLDEGFDLVYGVPAGRSPGAVRKLGSLLRDLLFLLLFGKRAFGRRPTSFRVFRSELVDRMLDVQPGRNRKELETEGPSAAHRGDSPEAENLGGRQYGAPVHSFLYLSAEFFRLTGNIAMVAYPSPSREIHHSRYPLARLVRTFAGLVLYVPVFPAGLRRHFGGVRWKVSEILEGELS